MLPSQCMSGESDATFVTSKPRPLSVDLQDTGEPMSINHVNKKKTSHLGMATVIRADTCFIYPYPRPNIHARIRARHPQRAQNHARTRYPRVSRARGHTRVPTRLRMTLANRSRRRLVQGAEDSRNGGDRSRPPGTRAARSPRRRPVQGRQRPPAAAGSGQRARCEHAWRGGGGPGGMLFQGRQASRELGGEGGNPQLRAAQAAVARG